MIRCVRLSTGHDGASHVELGSLDMQPGRNADLVSAAMSAAHDTEGSGHQWQLQGTDPWRRMYVVLAPGTEVPFVST
jgi:hypothetical protein